MAYMPVCRQGAVDVVVKGSPHQVLESAKQSQEQGYSSSWGQCLSRWETAHFRVPALERKNTAQPRLWKVSKSLQADREAQRTVCVYLRNTRFLLCYNVQAGSHRKLAILKDEAICTLKQFSIYEGSSLIVMSNDVNLLFYCFSNWVIFCILKNFLVNLIEYNFPFCFPVITERNLTSLWGMSALCGLEPNWNEKRNYMEDRVISAL